jgi:hypothetical protein
MDSGYIDILAISIDCSGLPMAAHNFVNISLEIVHPLLVRLIRLLLSLRVCVLFSFFFVNVSELLEMSGVFNQFYKVLPASRACDFIIFT